MGAVFRFGGGRDVECAAGAVDVLFAGVCVLTRQGEAGGAVLQTLVDDAQAGGQAALCPAGAVADEGAQVVGDGGEFGGGHGVGSWSDKLLLCVLSGCWRIQWAAMRSTRRSTSSASM